MDELQIFDFERDFAGSAIAIASYWSACHAKMPDEVADDRAFLIFLIESFADEPVKALEIGAHSEWSDLNYPPRTDGPGWTLKTAPPRVPLGARGVAGLDDRQQPPGNSLAARRDDAPWRT